MQHAALLLCVAAAGCSPRAASPPAPPPVPPGPKLALPDGGMRHTERLLQGGWVAPGCWMVCGHRGSGKDVAGLACRQVGAAESPCQSAPGSRTVTVDPTPPDSAPGGCRVWLEDISGDPAVRRPARATLIAPAGRTPLDEWSPAATDDGDYFAIETSFSPDGKWLGVARLAVGIGDGDKVVRVVSAEVRRAPPCR